MRTALIRTIAALSTSAAAAALMVTTVGATQTTAAAATTKACERVTTAAHRGAPTQSPYTEDTINVAKRAFSMGADWSETDIRLSANGTWWQLHDRSLDRTSNGRGWIKDKTNAYLKSVRTDDGQKFSTLDSLLWHLQTDNGGAFANTSPVIEIKADQYIGDHLTSAVRSIRRFGFADTAIIYSSDVDILQRLAALAPGIRRHYVHNDNNSRPLLARMPKFVQGINIDYSQATPEYVREAKARGVVVTARNANWVWMWAEMVKRPASDQPVIMTDRITRYREWCGTQTA